MASMLRDKELLYAELAKLIGAGFGIREAVRTLGTSRLPRRQGELLDGLDSGLDAGRSIAEAFGGKSRQVGVMERRLLEAGERSGNLGEAFLQLSEYFGMLARTRASVQKGLVYPLVLLHAGILVFFLTGSLMSGRVWEGVPGRTVLAVLGLWVVLTGLWVGVRVLLQMARHNAALDSLLGRLPWLGKARRMLAMARFARTWHACLLAGLPMRDTVLFSIESADSGLLRDAGARLCERVQAGATLGPGFLEESAFPPAFARSFLAGEEAGTLDVDTARWAEVFQTEANAALQAAASGIPRVVYAAVAVVIAWQIITFFRGYFGMWEQFEP